MCIATVREIRTCRNFGVLRLSCPRKKSIKMCRHNNIECVLRTAPETFSRRRAKGLMHTTWLLMVDLLSYYLVCVNVERPGLNAGSDPMYMVIRRVVCEPPPGGICRKTFENAFVKTAAKAGWTKPRKARTSERFFF